MSSNLIVAGGAVAAGAPVAAADQPPEGFEPSGGWLAIEAQVDDTAEELWGITERELKEIRRSLKELG